jgi:alkanesulfonate monooxygenase SsuD/methylene tetrahydromethanopterin reductase-like flavin-dependent oxidoreductase (luciferase family)
MDLALQTAGPYDAVLAAARWAEGRRLACFALPDHYLRSTTPDGVGDPAYDAFVQAGGLARETTSIRLSMLVSPVTFRHPAVLGKMAVTLDEMSAGRFSLGVGTGWLESEHEIFGLPFPERGERFDLLEEALAYLRAMFDPASPGFEGARFRLASQPVGPRPGPGLGLVVGGGGLHRTPELAGRYADEFNVYVGPDMADRIERARRAAETAGRDPDALLLSSAGAVVVGEDDAAYRRRLEEMAAEEAIPVEELEGRLEKREVPRGSAAAARAHLEQMAALGVRRFYVQIGVRGEFDPGPVAETFDLLGG